MKLGFCYKQSDGMYTLTVDRDCVEILMDQFKDHAKLLLQSESDIDVHGAVDVMSDWGKLYELSKEKNYGTNNSNE